MKIQKLSVSICIPAYNEGKNIKNIIHGILRQKTERIFINKIVVVCSGCTDDTARIAETFTRKDPGISVIREPKRNGKATAINKFLTFVDDPVVVVESADTVPYRHCIEELCAPFLTRPTLGMTGGAPIPVNDRNTFLGYIIHAWWWFHRNIPRFGEIIAFRNILSGVSPTTAVDEAYIQARMIKRGYEVVHVDSARIRNKGPEKLSDLIRQRRRIFNGHARLAREQNVKIDNMTKSSLSLLLFKYKMHSFKEVVWLLGGFALEFWARILGYIDCNIKHVNPFIWKTAKTTKNLDIDEALV